MIRFKLFDSAKANLCGLMLGVAVLLCSPGAWASATCTGGGQFYTLAFPASIAVSRDAPVGTLLTGWVSTPAVTNYFRCNVDQDIFTGTWFEPLSLSKANQTLSSGGMTYTVYNTTLAGVGIAFSYKIYTNGCGWLGPYDLGSAVGGAPLPWTGWTCNDYGNVTNGGALSAVLVKTGPTSGGVLSAQNVAQAAAVISDTNMGGSLASGVSYVTFGTTAVNFTALSCVTPNVVVPMGTHTTAELKGVGSTTTAVAFKLNLNSCPAGLGTTGPAIQYEIDPSTTLVSSGNAVVALNGASTASGMGLQLLTSSGTPVPLGTRQTFNGYSRSTGGNYTIPLQARYYQTGSTVTPGTANTEMTFTMTYQ